MGGGGLQVKLSLLHIPATQKLEPGSGLWGPWSRPLAPLTPGPVARGGPSGHGGHRHGQMEHVQGDAEARHQEGDADAEEGPRPRQEQQQQRVIGGGEEESREGQDEPEQGGGEPGVQRQRGQEEGRRRLTCRHCLKT